MVLYMYDIKWRSEKSNSTLSLASVLMRSTAASLPPPPPPERHEPVHPAGGAGVTAERDLHILQQVLRLAWGGRREERDRAGKRYGERRQADRRVIVPPPPPRSLGG